MQPGEAKAFYAISTYGHPSLELLIDWLPEGESERRTFNEALPPTSNAAFDDHVKKVEASRAADELAAERAIAETRRLLIELADGWGNYQEDPSARNKMRVQGIVGALPGNYAKEIGYAVDVPRDHWGPGSVAAGRHGPTTRGQGARSSERAHDRADLESLASEASRTSRCRPFTASPVLVPGRGRRVWLHRTRTPTRNGQSGTHRWAEGSQTSRGIAEDASAVRSVADAEPSNSRGRKARANDRKERVGGLQWCEKYLAEHETTKKTIAMPTVTPPGYGELAEFRKRLGFSMFRPTAAVKAAWLLAAFMPFVLPAHLTDSAPGKGGGPSATVRAGFPFPARRQCAVVIASRRP
jgi:hypothetical protein